MEPKPADIRMLRLLGFVGGSDPWEEASILPLVFWRASIVIDFKACVRFPYPASLEERESVP